jgi:hypothetical protein
MNRTIFTCISFALCAAAIGQTGSAQSSDDSIDNSSSPAAYIYVSRPTHVDGFAAASNGKLTAVSGSPFANIAISHMSVTKKFLFGAGDDSQTLFTYSIASNGSLKQVASLDAQAYNSSNCGGMGPITIDQTGSTLYNIVNNDCDDLIQAYKIESNGSLKYVGSTDSGIGTDLFVVGPLTFLGSNNYAYQWGCGGDSFPAGGLIQYKRQSNGILVAESYPTLPSPENTNDIYCPEAIASDPSDHMAVAAMEYDEYFDQIPPSLLVDYTTSSNGTLTTKSTYKNMPETGFDYVGTMSISPSGKLLAVGGQGFEIFHFNGSSQATKFSGVLQAGSSFQQFAWDKSNHLYALTENALYVYTVTTTSIEQAPGSPYSIPEASSVIVLSL